MKVSNTCPGCPCNFGSDESEYAQNAGCLPAPYDLLEYFEKENKVWACHDDPDKFCGGFVKWLSKRHPEDKTKLLKLIREKQIKHDWSVHPPEYDLEGIKEFKLQHPQTKDRFFGL